MAKEKGAAPSRRLPGRSGRASFEGDQVAAEGAGVRSAPSNDDDDAYAAGRAQQQSDVGSGSVPDAAAAAAGPPAATPAKKGRGRPRKKPLEPPPLSAKEEQDPEVAAIVARASPSSSPRTVGGWESGPVPGRLAVAIPKRDEGNKAGATAAVKDDNAAAAAAAEGDGADGNESDEWSDHDEVHYLPREVKAQFGQVVWAKMGNPPWPALVWDPRFLGNDKIARGVARMAYAAVGKSHLVKFYTTSKNPFACVPYKRIKPFDATELPTHLKACKVPKKKDTLKEDVQAAVEASLLTKSERLAEIHMVGRWTGNKKKKNSSTPKKANNTATSQTPTAASAEPPKKRGRGRPRKTPLPVKELDANPPSPVSSAGVEYELPVPEAEEGAEEEEKQEDGAMEEDEEEEAEEEEEEDEEEEEEEGGGDDDDEEEYTVEGEPEEEDDEDDKLSDEDFVAAKAGGGRKKKGRGRPRKNGGGGSGGGDGSGGGVGGKKKAKRPRPSSPSTSDGGGIDTLSGGEAPGNSSGKKRGQGGSIEPGRAKARALAVVRKFVAGLPPTEYGRDEGWIPSKEEAAREASARAGESGGGGSSGGGGARGGGNKRDRAGGGGGGEKKAKKLKASEERQREEAERKERLTQMKSSSEPIWKQHRRMKEEQGKGSGGGGGGGTSDGAAAGKAAAVGAPAGAGAGGNRESEIQTGRKLTQRLAKAGVEGKFNKEEVLEVLQKLGELGPSRELLQQSGCGKAVASARKYFSGGQVKHNDKEVATAASSLRTRWMNALAGGGSGGSSSGDKKTPPPPPPPPPLDRATSRSRTPPDSAQQGSSSKKQRVGEETPRSRSPKPETGGVPREGGGREPKRENGGKGGSPRGSSGGGRYGGGGGGREEGSAGGEGAAAVKKEATKEVKKEAKKEVAPAAAAAPAAPASAKMSTAVAKDEPRRRAMGMLMSVLGTTAAALERCTEIEEELHQSQGREISKEYLRRLRTAVFSMEGSDSQKLRDKVMSGYVVSSDFVSKSCEELRAMAGLT